MSDDPDRTPLAPTPGVSRRGFLAGLLVPAAAAIVAAPALSALAEAASKPRKKPAPAPEGTAKAAVRPGPDFSVCRTPAERAALERQWKQMLDTVGTLRKTLVPVGAEFSTGALAPRRLRRGEA